MIALSDHYRNAQRLYGTGVDTKERSTAQQNAILDQRITVASAETKWPKIGHSGQSKTLISHNRKSDVHDSVLPANRSSQGMTEQDLIARIGEAAVELVCERISEMMIDKGSFAGDGEGTDGHVYLSDCQMIDACNYRASGSFWWRDIEYSFLVDNGNWNGFVFLELSDTAPIPDVEVHRTRWAIAPLNTDVGTPQQARFLLAKWKAFEERADVKEMVRDYSYDRTWQPGGLIENHYRDKAAKIGALIVSEDHAKEIRRDLEALAQRAT